MSVKVFIILVNWQNKRIKGTYRRTLKFLVSLKSHYCTRMKNIQNCRICFQNLFFIEKIEDYERHYFIILKLFGNIL